MRDPLTLVGAGAFFLAVLYFGKGSYTSNRTRFFLFLGALFFSVLPVINLSGSDYRTTGGRYLYLPSLFFVGILVSGIQARLLSPERGAPARRWLGFALVAAMVLDMGLSGLYQLRLWNLATSISRGSIEQIARRLDGGAPIYVENLPGRFVEGPPILDDGFAYYFHPRPEVRTTMVRLRHLGGGRVTTTSWEDWRPDRGAAPDDIVIHLDLEGIPTKPSLFAPPPVQASSGDPSRSSGSP